MKTTIQYFLIVAVSTILAYFGIVQALSVPTVEVTQHGECKRYFDGSKVVPCPAAWEKLRAERLVVKE